MSAAGNPYEIVVAPEMADAEAAELTKRAGQLDWLLDAPEARDMPTAVGETGVLEALGRRLWDAAGLEAEELLDALEDAKDEDECVRLVIQGTDHAALPWELLYHDHPELGFLGKHSRCVIARRARGKGNWKGRPVAGSDLTAALDGLPRGHRPGLVVLAACRSARAAETAESIPDVARQLHGAGFERVLGMISISLGGSTSCGYFGFLIANTYLGGASWHTPESPPIPTRWAESPAFGACGYP